MNDIVVIDSVRGFVDSNGTAMLNAEDVARGFGFTQVKSGKEYVRWETINGYLVEFGFAKHVENTDFTRLRIDAETPTEDTKKTGHMQPMRAYMIKEVE